MEFTSPPPPDDAPLLEWALWYASQGWAVIPCSGKKPVGRYGLHHASSDEAHIRSWWAQWPGANIGLIVPQEQVVLDIDPRKGGDTTLHALQKQYGTLPDTLTSHTGGGGLHLFFCLTIPAKNKADIGEGIDVQALGSYVIAPPSIHPETARRYSWDIQDGPQEHGPQPAPSWLETLLTFPVTPVTPARDPQAPILEGTRETTLMALAGAMQRQGASPDAIRSALAAENERCVPPLDPQDLERMTRSVGRYAPAPRLEVSAPARAEPRQDTEGAWRFDALHLTRDRIPKVNAYNLGIILSQHPYWQEETRRLWFDVVRGRHMLGARGLTDGDVFHASHWMGQTWQMHVTTLGLFHAAFHAVCETRPRDLLQEWLASLPPWDQEIRLPHWLRIVCGVPDTPYHRNVSRLLPVSIVARILHPGCQYRYVIILEGVQDAGKSKTLAALAGEEWHIDLGTDFDSKETYINMRGALIAELGELRSLGRTNVDRFKQFVTQQWDKYTPKYANNRIEYPRRTILVGTTNRIREPYWKDDTGATRLLPVVVVKVTPEAVPVLRDQLFAEAIMYYRMHPDDWWKIVPEAEEELAEARDLRMEKSVLHDAIAQWLEELVKPGVYRNILAPRTAEESLATGVPIGMMQTSVESILKGFLGMEVRDWPEKKAPQEIVKVLRALDWQKIGNRRRSDEGIRYYPWQKPRG